MVLLVRRVSGEGVIQEGFLEEALLDLGRVGDNWAKKGRSRLSIC